MNHQPYEEWLFASEDRPAGELSPIQERELKEHLQSCESCRQLVEDWRAVKVQLEKRTMESPSAGFTLRWKELLDAERRRVHRAQSLLVLGFSLGGALLLLGSLTILALPYIQTPAALFWTWLYRALVVISYIATLRDVLPGLLGAMSGVLPVIGWVFLIGVVSELCALWVISLRLITHPRRISR